MSSLTRSCLVAGLVAVATCASGGTGPATVADLSGPCGALAHDYDPAHRPSYDHVVVIMDENLSYGTFLKSGTDMPYLKSLSARCGSEAGMHAATHPSKNNYLAATSGILTDSTGSMTPYHTADNIFHQMQTAKDPTTGLSRGLTWANYAESERVPCQGTQHDPYKPGHVPAWYYNDIHKTTCPTNQVPMDRMDVRNLPSYTWISPNECHGVYYVSVCKTLYGTTAKQRFRVGDNWLSKMIPSITSTASYQGGRTLIIITFDEGDRTKPHYIDCSDPTVYRDPSNYCTIPTVVVSPYIVPGTVDSSDQNLYTLLGTTEDILHVPRLNRALTHPASMRPGLGF